MTDLCSSKAEATGTTETIQVRQGNKRSLRHQEIKISERKKKKFKSAYLLADEEDDLEVIPPGNHTLRGKGKADSLAPPELSEEAAFQSDVSERNISTSSRNMKKLKNDKHELDACVEANPHFQVKALPSIGHIHRQAAGSKKVALKKNSDVEVLIARLQKSVRDIEKTQGALEEKRKKLLSRITDLQTQSSRT
ncbi:hypothetical protein L210DRAFT_989816 [Boletus edulis BED1]|uniref:Uncharacterized protein n=1 Tax=Boletus edulis BED1 TaxID=1328754 RepID=A0AAD4BAB9_BOLED|nr:hypothetical protein L210DRAFT_989816 [Boletus edulis BED1]